MFFKPFRTYTCDIFIQKKQVHFQRQIEPIPLFLSNVFLCHKTYDSARAIHMIEATRTHANPHICAIASHAALVYRMK